MKIAIYKSEIEDGLEEAIASNNSIAFSTPATISKMSESEEAIARDVAIDKLLSKAESNPDQIDLYYLNSVLVSTGWNKNDDVFSKREMWAARKTPEDKQFNFMHDEKDIIGHITSSIVIDAEGKTIEDGLNSKDLPEKFDIITSAVLYNSWSDPDLKDRMGNLIDEIEGGKWYVSMECLFAGFDYALVDPKGNHKVLARDKASAFLTKHLRAYGGSGEYEGYKIGRLLNNVAFSGKGLVSNPANPRSVILNDVDPFDDAEAITITTSNFKENSNMSNELLEKQIEELKADLVKAKSDAAALKAEISNQKDEEIKTQVEAFEAKLAEHDEAVNQAKADLEAMESKVAELEGSLTDKDEKLNEATAKIETHEAEVKTMARRAALVEAGVDEADIEGLLETFAEATDEMFEAVVAMGPKKPPKGEWPPKKKDDDKDDDKDEKGRRTPSSSEVEADLQTDESDEAEEGAEADILEDAEEEVEPALADGGDDALEELSSVASEWLETKVLRTTANLKK
jgi:hypothetical protein